MDLRDEQWAMVAPYLEMPRSSTWCCSVSRRWITRVRLAPLERASVGADRHRRKPAQ